MALIIRRPVAPNRPGRRLEAATLILSWVVTDKPGEWSHGEIIEEAADMGHSRRTTANAIRDLKDAGLIRAVKQRNNSHRLYSTEAGRACYYAKSTI